jgi:hypothetical protein
VALPIQTKILHSLISHLLSRKSTPGIDQGAFLCLPDCRTKIRRSARGVPIDLVQSGRQPARQPASARGLRQRLPAVGDLVKLAAVR